jgi:hypothetical protein
MNEAWRLIAENRIEEAIANGEFDDLPGKGQPLDLTDYFNTPVEDRMAFSILKNAAVVPSEVLLLKEVDELEKQSMDCTQPSERVRLRVLAQSKRVKLSIALEFRNKPSPAPRTLGFRAWCRKRSQD